MKFVRTVYYTKSIISKTCTSIVIPEISFMERDENKIYYYIKGRSSMNGSFLWLNSSLRPFVEVFDSEKEAIKVYNCILEILDEYHSNSER